jgi:hypothetical protein
MHRHSSILEHSHPHSHGAKSSHTHAIEPITQAKITQSLTQTKILKEDSAKDVLDSIKFTQTTKQIEVPKKEISNATPLDLAKTKASAKIAKSVALVENAKAVATAQIATAVSDVKIAQIKDKKEPISEQKIKREQEKSDIQIKKAIQTTQNAKDKSANKIAKSIIKLEKAIPEDKDIISNVSSQQDITKMLTTVKIIKENAAKEILKSIKFIESNEPVNKEESKEVKSTSVEIAKAKAAAKIAKSIAYVESAKAEATAQIAQAVAEVKLAEVNSEDKSISPDKLKIEQEKSAVAITKAVATTQIAKAKAAQTIAKSVEKVERARVETEK